jgi:single-stranded DNA-binding protein
MFKNSITLSGKALKNSERKGNGPYRFTLVQGGGRKKDSEDRWPREYFNCECWPDVEGADTVKAGEVVYVEGRLKQKEWTDAAGDKKRGYCIACSVVSPHTDEPKPVARPNNLEITDADIPF